MNQSTGKYSVQKKKRTRRLRIVTGLACVVVFCTVYALILPAITMEKGACEIPEHSHTQECYSQVLSVEKTVPVCDAQTLALHQHDGSCYDGEGNPVCGYADFVVHQHDASCYDADGNFWCSLPEIGVHQHTGSCYTQPAEVHTHTDDCYTVERGELLCAEHVHTEACYTESAVLVCAEEHEHEEGCYETRRELCCGIDSDHQHTDGCYEQIKTLICDLPTEPAEEDREPVLICGTPEIILHEHTADCFDGSGRPVCGMLQVLAHQHSEDCFQTVEQPADTETLTCTNTEENHSHTALCYGTWELTCGLEEHIHTAECSADPTADVETAQEWEQTFALVRLTGEWPVDVLAIAKTQLGYSESEKNYVVGEDGTGRGYTRYGDWFGCPYGDWCAMFASFCVHYADVEGMPLDMSCPSWIEELRALNLYRPARSGDPQQQYIPAAGDLVFYDWEQDGIADHVGLVVEVTPATEEEAARLITLEGNVEDRVQYMSYALDNPAILGFGQLPQQTFYCGKTGHAHTADCGGEDVCPLEEHIHSEPCLTENTVISDQERLAELIALIDALPTTEEVEEKLAALEEAEDEEGYEAYFEEVRKQCVPVYIFYQALEPQLQELVTNRDKLLALEWLWSGMTYALTDTLNVTAVNSHSYSATIIYHSPNGMSVGDNTSGEKNYAFWTAVVVESENGRYVVKQIVGANGASKSSLYASGNGFILLFHENNVSASLNASVGDTVTMSSDFWKTKHSYNNGEVFGTVTFTSSSAQQKPAKDNSGKLTIVPGADTRDIIEVNLYDYGANINDLYNSNSNYPGFQQEYGSTDVGTSFSKWLSFNFGNNITADLAAGQPNVTNSGGAINTTTNGANSPISGAMQPTLGADGYPALVEDNISLGYLFSDSGYAVKKNSQSINGLFQYNEATGAYSFNSRENHAQFNGGDDTFTLYGQIISSNFMMYPFGNFLPFNDIVHLSAQASTIDKAYLEAIASSAQYKYNNGNYDKVTHDAYGTLSTQLRRFIGLMDNAYPNGWTAADCMNEYFRAAGIPRIFSNDEPLVQQLYSIDYDEPTDFYFGMEMKMNFMQPKGGLTGIDGKQPMVFYFTGDDDVWVYVDGVLFLDLSGIHRHVGGEIDFVKGEVKYYSLDKNTGDVGTTPYDTVPFSDLVSTGLNEKGTFADYSKHSFNFYYMERGSGSGVCRMNFNFPLLRKNTISVTKELSVDEQDKLPLLGNPDFRFQVLQENGTDLFIAAGTEYDILDTAGNKIGTGTVDENGVFTLKANQTAVFSNIAENEGKYFVRELLKPEDFEQYGTIWVNGNTQTTDYNIPVGSETFNGVNSPVQDVSNGSTSFHFNNQVTFNKLGSLSIGKTLTSYSPTRSAARFDFEVTLDGVPLPVGTVYIVGEETRTVEAAGIISLAPGETAVIANILSGSRFTVKEIAASADDYVVTYSVDDVPVMAENGVSGVIQTDKEVQISVNNAEQGATVTIPVQKTLQAPDGKEHTYKFQLEQVKGPSDATPVEPTFAREMTIPVCVEPADGAFEIGYAKAGLEALPQTFYYKITETVDREAQPDTSFDSSVYIVEVTVEDNGGTLSAAVTKVWKDGAELTASDGQVPAVAFTNTIVRYELPQTGGAGALTYALGGLLLMAAAGCSLVYYHSKRRKGASPSS